MYAEVIVNLPIEGTFHYHIPAELAGRLQAGHLVEVEFGPQKAQGVILRLDPVSPVSETKPVEALVDRAPVVTGMQLALAEWLSETYLAPLAECVRLCIPPGLSRRGDVLVSLAVSPEEIEPTTDTQKRLLSLLIRRGPLRGRQVARALPQRDWRGAVARLVDRGLLTREPVLDRPSIRVKQVRTVELSFPPARLEDVIARDFDEDAVPPNRRPTLRRRAAILRALAKAREPVEVGWVYANVEGSKLADLRVLTEDDYVALSEQEVWRDPLAGQTFVPAEAPPLTPDQAAAWAVIESTLEAGDGPPRPVLLHGVTGSGKTELYLRAVQKALEQGRRALALVPEIALTPQTVRRFAARFPGQMGLAHSHLSPGERYDTWRRARAGLLDLVIGTRSALFTPLDNLGLIVLDECHDDSYKQSPPTAPPYYHALPTAIELARLTGASVIMGSATPNVTTYHCARRGDYTLLDLPGRIMGHRETIQSQARYYHVAETRYAHADGDPDAAVMIGLPPVEIVDMRQELRAGNRSIFSRALTAALETVLDREEQAILFLNRRGTATYVFCRACGEALRCPRCDIPLTWHTFGQPPQSGRGRLICHYCNYQASHPEICPACGSDQIKFFGGGTEQVEQEVLRQFPQARPIRWDRDTTGGKDSHGAILQRFIDREADVMIGTQMVAKGLDLPLVTLVGVISADTALYLPDFRSNERTFQLLAQVAGRAGRGLLGGEVILQTYAPENYAIQAASMHDFFAFQARELHYRAELGYPPYARLGRVVIRATSGSAARQEAERVHAILRERIVEERLQATSLIGPAPCFYARLDNFHRWHVIARSQDPAAILRDLWPRAPVQFQIDIDPVSLL